MISVQKQEQAATSSACVLVTKPVHHHFNKSKQFLEQKVTSGRHVSETDRSFALSGAPYVLVAHPTYRSFTARGLEGNVLTDGPANA